jgi:hypothetical protein
MNAPVFTLPSGAGNGINSSGQVNPVQWATTAFAQEAAQRAITLPSTRTVCDWLDYKRSKRTTLGYARLVG